MPDLMCPFCDALPKPLSIAWVDSVMCRTPGCPIRSIAIERATWNTRAPAPPSEGIAAVVREASDAVAVAKRLRRSYATLLDEAIESLTPAEREACGVTK